MQMSTQGQQKQVKGARTNSLNTTKRPGKIKIILRVFFTAIGITVPLLLDAQKQDIAKVFPAHDNSQNNITLTASGSALPKNTLVTNLPDTTQLMASVGMSFSRTPENATTSSPIKMSGEKFADVKVGKETVLIGDYIPVGGKNKYSVEIDLASDMAQLNVTPRDAQEIVFHTNADQSKQMILIFKKGAIIIFIDDAEVLKAEKKGDKVKALVIMMGCAQGGEISQWKIGSDGSFVMKNTTQDTIILTGFTMTNPVKLFAFGCDKGDIGQVIVKDNIRIITAGNDLVLIAPDFGYKSTEQYDGGFVFEPVIDPAGKRIFFATPKKLHIERPDGKTTRVVWDKVISAIKANGKDIEVPAGDLENVALLYSPDVLGVASTSFKMTNGNGYKIQMNLTTKEVTLVEIPRVTTMVN